MDTTRPIIVASTREGMLRVQIGQVVYEYWLDSALHSWVKRQFVKRPWETLNFIKSRCWSWKKL